MVVGRAGIGLDNVDVDAATRRGVMVVNAPQSNIISAAEHTMALLLAQARNVPQAHAALTAGRWERSKWEGVELADKTLAVIGLGRIGKLVADRAKAFRDAGHRLRPLRVGRARPPDGRRAGAPRPGGRRGRLPHRAPAEDQGDHGADQPRSAVEGQAVVEGDQRRPRRHRRRAVAGRVHPRRHHRRRRRRCLRHRAHHLVAAVRARQRGGDPPPRGQHPRGAGQGRRHHRRHGAARPRRRLRALRGQRRRCRGQRDPAPVPAPRRAPRSSLRFSRRRLTRFARGVRRRRHRRLRHPHPAPGGVEGFLRRDQRRAGHLRERAAARQAARHRGEGGEGRPRRPDFVNLLTLRGAGHTWPAPWSAGAASSGS